MPTIMIVDDEYIITNILGRLLEDAGYKALTILSARKGLEIMSCVQPDLVITDLMMPDMNGSEFAAVIRSRPATQHLPIILITGAPHTDAGHRAVHESFGQTIRF